MRQFTTKRRNILCLWTSHLLVNNRVVIIRVMVTSPNSRANEALTLSDHIPKLEFSFLSLQNPLSLCLLFCSHAGSSSCLVLWHIPLPIPNSSFQSSCLSFLGSTFSESYSSTLQLLFKSKSLLVPLPSLSNLVPFSLTSQSQPPAVIPTLLPWFKSLPSSHSFCVVCSNFPIKPLCLCGHFLSQHGPGCVAAHGNAKPSAQPLRDVSWGGRTGFMIES